MSVILFPKLSRFDISYRDTHNIVEIIHVISLHAICNLSMPKVALIVQS